MKKISPDQQSAQVVKQAIKDDQSLAAVANDIHVTVKDGAITLDGEVATAQQMNLAANTATAVGEVDEIENHLEVVPKVKEETGPSSVEESIEEYNNAKKDNPKKKSIYGLANELSRAEDDGLALRL